jgi:hypothetical protein
MYKTLFVKLLKVGGDAVFVVGFVLEVVGEGVGDVADGATTVDEVPDGGTVFFEADTDSGRFGFWNKKSLHKAASEAGESDHRPLSLVFSGDMGADYGRHIEEIDFVFAHFNLSAFFKGNRTK